MKTTLITISILLVGITAKTQITSKELIGEWHLNSFIDKNISESEKQKRYIFTADSLTYNSRRKNAKGTYTLQPETGECEWYINEMDKPIKLRLKKVVPDTLHIKEMRGENPVTGVLVRISHK